MSILRFDTVRDRSEEMIQSVMSSEEIVSLPEMEFILRLVVEEIVTNIAYYAYPEGEDGALTVNITNDGEKISLSFCDNGVAFDPLKKDDPDVTLSAEERAIGGLGIFLVKQMMDEVVYQRTDNMNILTCSKSIN